MRPFAINRVLIYTRTSVSNGGLDSSGILIAKGTNDLELVPQMANRHGLIAGATGTGKTVTLQTMAEGLSRTGVPVFMADVKGDLAGMSQPGGNNPKIADRAKQLGLTLTPQSMPVVFWDVFKQQGHPARATVSEMGPLLLSRMLGLNDTQESVLTLVFKIADDNGLLLLDMKDLRAMLQHVGDTADQFQTEYGHVSAASIGAIQRNLLALEQQGGDDLFGEPALDLSDLMQTDAQGRGVLNILAADKLVARPRPMPPSSSGCFQNCSSNCRRWAIPRNPSWCSSSMRRIFCLRTAPSPARQDRAGGPAGTLQGHRCLLRDTEPTGRARRCARPTE